MSKFTRYMLTAFGFTILMATIAFWSAPYVIAQVKAALVQNVDEPGRHPIARSTIAGSSASFSVPAAQRYVIEQYTAECDVDNTNSLTDVRVLVSTSGQIVSAATTPHFLEANGFAGGHAVNSWIGSGTTRLYADPGTTIGLQVLDGAGGSVTRDCSFQISGYAITLP